MTPLMLCLFLNLTLSAHSNNWAVIVSTSKFWYNYRHSANALSIYHIVKENGIPDAQIILMLSEDTACDRRNIFPGSVFNQQGGSDLYTDDMEVDYRGEEVTIENLLRVLTGRHKKETPMSKRLNTDAFSNILIYLTGHGGDNFLKFNDKDDFQSQDLADALKQMEIQRRYNEVLIIADTCEAFSLYKSIYSPDVIAISSSDIGENSYSYGYDTEIGNTLIDRFTHFTLEYFAKAKMQSNLTKYFDYISEQDLKSTPKFAAFDFRRGVENVKLGDFFGSQVAAVVGGGRYRLGENRKPRVFAEEGEVVEKRGDGGKEEEGFGSGDLRDLRDLRAVGFVTAGLFLVALGVSLFRR